MSIVAAELIAEITVKGAEAAIGQIEGLGGVVGSVGGALATFGVAAAGALIGVGAESVKMAGDFQQSLTQLVTGAGESQKNLQMVSDGILNLAVATGTSTGQLTEAMYMIESAGYRGASALDVLKASAEGAKAGNADLGTTAKAVTIVMHDYASSHITATQAANALIATEQNGQAHLQELAKSMGAVLPIASAAGVSFQDVAGAIALMTTGGMTAQHASQNLANAIRSLEAPSSVAQKAMQSVGLSAQDLKDTLSTKGLDGAIQLVSDDVGRKFPAGSVQSVEAFKAIMGGATGYNVALQLGGAHMKAYQDDIKKIGDALHKGGSDVEGFALVQQNFNFKLDQAKEAINVLMIRLGTALLPVLGQVLTAVTPLISGFSEWITSSNGLQQILGVLGGVFQSIMGYLNSDAFAGVVADFQTLGNQIGRALIPLLMQLGPLFGDIFSSIGPILTGVVIPAIDLLVFNLGQLALFFNENKLAAQILGDALVGIGVAFAAIKIGAFIATIPELVAGFIVWAGAAWTAAAGTIAATWPLLALGAVIAIVVAGIILAIQHWGDITKWFQGVWGGFTGWLGGTLQAIGGFFSSVWGGILAGLQAAWNGILATTRAGAQMFSGVWNAIGAGLQAAWNGIVTIAKVGAQLLFTAIFGQIVAIVQVFQWLYNHNYYFKDLVDAIVGFMQGCMNWLRGAWNDIANWLAGVWHGITGTATSAWNGTGSAITSATNPVLAWLRSSWNATISWLAGVWNGAVGIARAAWNAVSSAIMSVVNPLLSWLTSAFRVAIGVIGSVLSTVGGYASAAMNALAGAFNWGLAQVRGIMSAIGNAVVAPLAGLVGQAFSWGSGIISGFIDGIRSRIGDAGQAAADVVQKVKDFLGFHSPAKMGEGRYIVEWGQGMIEGFNQGVMKAIPQLQTTVNMAVTAGTAPMRPAATVPAPFLAQSRQPAPQIIVQPAPVYLDGRALAQGLMPYVASQIRYGTGVR